MNNIEVGIDPIAVTFETANQVMKNPRFVFIDEKKIDEFVDQFGDELRTLKDIRFDMPKLPFLTQDDLNSLVEVEEAEKEQLIMFELLANSVNYCYWYGRPEVRPGGANAGLMYELLEQAFNEAPSNDIFMIRMTFEKLMMQHRFPLMEARIRHLQEIGLSQEEMGGNLFPYSAAGCFAKTLAACIDKQIDISAWLRNLVSLFPGFGDDIFLKRASLFFIMLYRRKGWFADQIHRVPIPVDYHIPNVLRHHNCLKYDPSLSKMIDNYTLIPSGSLYEAEIRSTSLVAAKQIADKAECSMADVDTLLFSRRTTPKDPFHLTITTHY